VNMLERELVSDFTGMLQCVAVCCSKLSSLVNSVASVRATAGMLQCDGCCCSALQCVAVSYSTLR